MAEQRYLSFGEICEHSAFGPRFSSDEYASDGNVACLRTMDIDGTGRINFDAMPLARLDLSRLQNHILRRDDLVITRTGAYLGKAAVFSEFCLPVLPGAFSIRFRLKRDIADPFFVRYYFNSSLGQDAVRSISTGSAQPNINIPNLHSLKIPVPPLRVQKAVAAMLLELDDKIELNARMNATLEAMARALFKAWFVDFEPVHANLENRPSTSASPEIARLFPSDLNDGIPTGWRNGTITEIARISKDSVSPIKFPDEEFHHFSIPAFDDGKYPKKEPGSTILSNKFHIQKNAVLVSKLNPRIFRVWTVYPTTDFRCIASTEFIVYEPQEDAFWSFLNCLMRSDEIISSFRQHVTGTSGSHQRVRPESTLNIPVSLPTTNIAKAFDEIVSPMRVLAQENIDQMQALSELRDALLPRLMSGKIRSR